MRIGYGSSACEHGLYSEQVVKSRAWVNPDQLASGERELLWNTAMNAEQRGLGGHPKRYASILPWAIRSGERLSCVARLEAHLECSLPAVYYCPGLYIP